MPLGLHMGHKPILPEKLEHSPVDQHVRDPNKAKKKAVFKDVRYIMTTPRIPRDISCLKDCRLPLKVKKHSLENYLLHSYLGQL